MWEAIWVVGVYLGDMGEGNWMVGEVIWVVQESTWVEWGEAKWMVGEVIWVMWGDTLCSVGGQVVSSMSCGWKVLMTVGRGGVGIFDIIGPLFLWEELGCVYYIYN